MTARRSHRLLQLGILLFLLGLLTGFAIPVLSNPRMGLSSHLEGVLNGMFLLALGLIWPRLRLGPAAAATTYWLAIYGTFANWAATLLAAAWGAGRTMPLAAGAQQGTPTQEMVIMGLLASLSLAAVAVCGLILWGLRRAPA
jgi:hydroxylaminobenzene mutase